MTNVADLPTFPVWDEFESVVKDRIKEVRNYGLEKCGENYLRSYGSALEAYRIKVVRHVARQGKEETERWKYLSYSVLWGSTPDFKDSPYLDFEGGVSVLTFLEERIQEIDELARVRKDSQNRKL